MGKTSRWFRALLGGKKSSEKKKRASVRSSNADDWSVGVEALPPDTYPDSIDANKHAIAMAAATAAVAEAALAAAQAAAEVVRMTGGTGSRAWSHRRREFAAVKIQSAFRAYLARRALRALKGLVRLQALVRGHIIRKQSADMLRRMQALARIQARVCANRAQVSDTSHCSSKSSQSQYPSSRSNIKIKSHIDHERSPLGSTWLQQWMEECSRNIQDDERSDKILEVDTWKPRRSTKAYDKNPSISSGEVLSLRSLKFQKQVDHLQQALASDSPQACSATSRPGSSCRRGAPSTPARSEFSRSVFSEFLGQHPNYMASTESSSAKLRSLSAPRQRMHSEKPRSNQRFVPGFREADTTSEIGSGMYADFKTSLYQGQGYSNRTQTPVRSYSAARYRPHFEGL